MRTRIPTLDGYRAVAILATIALHAGIAWNATYIEPLARGVDLFFAISGFLITSILVDEEGRTGGISLPDFYIRRVFRIFPPFLTVVAFILIMGLWVTPMEMISSLFFFRNYYPDFQKDWYTLHFWSLSVEEHFYLLWPAILAFAGSKRARKLALWMALAVGAWRVTNAQFHWTEIAGVLAVIRTDFRLDALLWGCIFGLLLGDAPAKIKFTKQMTFGMWIFFAVASVLASCFYSPLITILLAMFLALTVAGTTVHPEWKISRLLEWKPVRFVGSISYSLYLWQQIFIAPAVDQHGHPWWQQFPANLVMTFVAATASYYVIEQPLIRFGRRWASTRKVLRPAYRLSVYGQ